jgi:hypothetical protein
MKAYVIFPDHPSHLLLLLIKQIVKLFIGGSEQLSWKGSYLQQSGMSQPDKERW